MAINFTTFETTLQGKLDAVTDPKEMLLLGKAIESTIGNLTVSDIQAAGDAELADIAAAVATEVASIVDGAPDALNTLNEIAAAMNDDPNFYNTVMVKTAPVLAGNLDGAGYTYTNLHPAVTTASVTTTQNVSLNDPMSVLTMTAATTFTPTDLAAGKTAMFILDTSATPFTPSFAATVKWPAEEEPTWADSRYWIVTMAAVDGTNVLASAQGYTV